MTLEARSDVGFVAEGLELQASNAFAVRPVSGLGNEAHYRKRAAPGKMWSTIL